MKRLSLMLATFCAFAVPPVLAQDAGQRDRAYRWIEAGFGGQAISADNGFGNTARGTYRVAGMAPIGGPVHLTASYTGANYQFQFYDWISGGFGVHVPFGPDLHAVAQLTYEQNETRDFSEDGTGLEAGLRWFGAATELGLSVEFSGLEGFGGLIDDRYWGVNVVALVPMGRRAGITLRIERSYAEGDYYGGQDVLFDTYLVGMRYGY